MRILLDVDGVAADWIRHFKDTTGFDVDDTQWDVFGGMEPGHREVAESVMADPDFWLSIPVIDGAQEAVSRLQLLGHEVVWVTSPWESCEAWGAARRNWLKRYFADVKHIFTKEKHMVEGDIFVDDKPDNVKRWQESHPQGHSYLYDQPHNRDTDWRRVTWGTFPI